MCRGCWEEYGSPSTDTPLVRYAAETVKDLYGAHPAGGALHIVVDDYNVEDEHLQMVEDQCLDGLEAACLTALKALSEDERASAIALHGGLWA